MKLNEMREKSIEGRWISDPIGFCHYEKHRGALNRSLAIKHKCLAKRCHHLEKYNDNAWKKKHTKKKGWKPKKPTQRAWKR